MALSAQYAALAANAGDPSTHSSVCDALATLPSKERLALASAVARTAHASAKPSARPPWRAAISVLRELAPKLAAKPTNGVQAAPRAAVETYAALYALAVAEDSAASTEELVDAASVATAALQSVLPMPAGNDASKQKRGRAKKPRAEDVIDVDTAALLDCILFSGAGTIPWERMLPATSVDSAGVVVPALLAKLLLTNAGLDDRLSVTRMLLLPWLNSMKMRAERETVSPSAADAYRRKARSAMFRVAEGASGDPRGALQARVTGLGLFPGEPHEFAKIMLRSANSFLRSGRDSADRGSRRQAAANRDYGFVSSLYRDAIPLFKRSVQHSASSVVCTHGHEDACAWFDHVMISFCSAGDGGPLFREAAELAVQREKLLENSALSHACKLQRILVDGNMYSRNPHQWIDAEARLSRTVLSQHQSTHQPSAADCLKEYLDDIRKGHHPDIPSSSQLDGQDGSAILRTLRVLEPVRAVVCASKAEWTLQLASVDLLTCYVEIFMVAQTLKCEAGIKERLEAMVGSALSACEVTMKVHASRRASQGLEHALSTCMSILRRVTRDRGQWAKWASAMLNNIGVDLYNRHVKRPSSLDLEFLRHAGVFMEESVFCLAACHDQELEARCPCPALPQLSIERCVARLAAAADAYSAAGSDSAREAVDVATVALHLCCLHSFQVPEFLYCAFARASTCQTARDGADVVEILNAHVSHHLIREHSRSSRRLPHLDCSSRASRQMHTLARRESESHGDSLNRDLLECAFEALQMSSISRRKKVGTGRAEGVEVSPRLVATINGERAILCELGQHCDGTGLDCCPAYALARANVLTGREDSLSSARLLVRNIISDSCRDSYCCEYYVALAEAWLAVEGLDVDAIDVSLAKLKACVETLAQSQSVWPRHSRRQIALGHALELSESLIFSLTLYDLDSAAVEACSVARESAVALGVPCSMHASSHLFRRLGWSQQFWAAVRKDETAGHGECIGVHGSMLNDLCRFRDAEVVVRDCEDSLSCGARADAAVKGRGNIFESLNAAKAALKTLLKELSADMALSRTQEVEYLTVGDIPVPVSRSGSESLLPHTRARHRLLTELALCLGRLAALHCRIDNHTEARYFESKARQLAKYLDVPALNAELSMRVSAFPAPFASRHGGRDIADPGLQDNIADYVHPCHDASRDGESFVNSLVLVRGLLGHADFALEPPGVVEEAIIKKALDFCEEAAALISICADFDEVDPVVLGTLTWHLWYRKGMALYRLGDYMSSRNALEHSIQLSTSCHEDELASCVALVQLEIEHGKWDRAISVLNTAFQLVTARPVCAPRVVRRLFRARVSTILGLEQSGQVGDISCLATGLIAGHGLSLAIRHAVRRENSWPVGDTDGLVNQLGSLSLSPFQNATEQLRNSLPGTSIAVGLSMVADKSALILWRVSRSADCFVLRLPLPETGSLSYEGVLERFTNIQEAMKTESAQEEPELTPRAKANWWKRRFALDHALGELMFEIEDVWLGPANALLLPAQISGNCSSKSPLAEAYYAAMLSSPDAVSEENFALVAKLAVCSRESVPAAMGVLRDLKNGKSQPRTTRARTRSRSNMAIPVGGLSRSVVGELFLAIDNQLEGLPWESLPILRAAKCSTARLPHYSFLESSKTRGTVDVSRVFYLLNPSGDLDSTQRTFESSFQSQTGWAGVSGAGSEDPDASAIMSEVERSDVFLYCGHGGGEEYVSPRKFKGSEGRQYLPVSILMGCSSGRLNRYTGDAESSGTVFDYLTAGAPAVVANLWDVSDRDIDRLTLAFLTEWLGLGNTSRECAPVGDAQTVNLGIALARARDACRLPFLVGAATVIYGRPDISAV